MKTDGKSDSIAFYPKTVVVKYNQYDIEDFLADEDFILWVKNQNETSSFFFQSWLNSNPPNGDKALIARELLLSLKPQYLEGSKDEFDHVLSKLMKSRYFQKESNYRFFNSASNLWWRVAAIIIVAFSISFIIHGIRLTPEKKELASSIKLVSKENPPGQRSQIQLPDGTVVYLNALSKLVYSENYGKSSRFLDLQGEAYFEVKINRQIPFVVRTGDIYTKALGTSFNIKTHGAHQEVTISLLTGKVEIGNLLDDQVSKTILTPGEKVIARTDEIYKTRFEYNDIAWKDGVIVFDKASLEQVITTLQQWYGVEIKLENTPVDEWHYTGKFKNNSLEIVLERMSYTQYFDYKIENGFVTIKF